MEKPVLVVLAAGMGSRYGGLKQMDSVGSCGQCLIDYSIYDARRAGFEKVIFVINRELEADFRALVGSRISRGMEVRYAFQEMEDMVGDVPIPPSRTKPWGTTHAVLAARELIDGPFAVINADDYYGPEVGYYLGKTLSDNGGVTRGVCRINRDGLLESIVEQQNIEREGEGGRFTTDDGQNWNYLSGETLVSMNFWGFQRSFLEEARERFPLLLRRATTRKRGRCSCPSWWRTCWTGDGPRCGCCPAGRSGSASPTGRISPRWWRPCGKRRSRACIRRTCGPDLRFHEHPRKIAIL